MRSYRFLCKAKKKDSEEGLEPWVSRNRRRYVHGEKGWVILKCQYNYQIGSSGNPCRLEPFPTRWEDFNQTRPNLCNGQPEIRLQESADRLSSYGHVSGSVSNLGRVHLKVKSCFYIAFSSSPWKLSISFRPSCASVYRRHIFQTFTEFNWTLGITSNNLRRPLLLNLLDSLIWAASFLLIKHEF